MGKRFTPEQDTLLTEMWKTHSYPDICKEFGMSQPEIYRRARRLGLGPKNGLPFKHNAEILKSVEALAKKHDCSLKTVVHRIVHVTKDKM